jgi:hypothetical protein
MNAVQEAYKMGFTDGKIAFAERLKKRFEDFAELEHKQWTEWSKDLMQKEKLSSSRIERWKRLQTTPYKDLSEKEKDDDRRFVKKIFDIIDEELKK